MKIDIKNAEHLRNAALAVLKALEPEKTSAPVQISESKPMNNNQRRQYIEECYATGRFHKPQELKRRK